jgi:ABC-type glycerol-3-phosphate transport system substrate-binding protein
MDDPIKNPVRVYGIFCGLKNLSKEERMKKTLILCLTVLLLLPLSGLFAEGKKEGAAEVKEITVWSWGASDAIQEGLIKRCWPIIEKEFNLKVNHEQFPGLSETEFIIKVVNAAKFGKGPDIVEGNGLIVSDLAYQGFIQPIPSDLDRKLQAALLPAYNKANYLWDRNGKKLPIMGVVVRDGGGQAVWWNEQMYREAGLNRAPATWDEVFEFGQKLVKKDADGNITRSGFYFRTGGHIDGISDKWHPFFLCAGDFNTFLERDASGRVKARLNVQQGRDAVQFYLDGVYKYKIDAIGIPGDVGGWIKGQTATISARRAWVPLNVKLNGPEMYPKLRAAAIPVKQKGIKSRTTFHTYGMAVNPKSSDAVKEVIWKICARLLDEDMVKLFVNDINMWLPYKAAQGKPPFDEPIWKEYLDVMATVLNRVEAPRFAMAFNIIGEQLQLCFAKEKSVEDALKAAEDKLNEIFEGVVLKD